MSAVIEFAAILSTLIPPSFTAIVPSSRVSVVPAASSEELRRVIKLFVEIVLPLFVISAKIESFA